MIRHRPSIAVEMKRFRLAPRRRLKVPTCKSDFLLRQEHARLAANAVLYDPPGNPTPEDILIARQDTQAIDRALLKLPARSERIVRMYFGLGDDEPHTLAQIGEFLGTRRERPRQILAQTYRKLARPLASLRGKVATRHCDACRDALEMPQQLEQPTKQPWGTPIIVEVPAMWGPIVEKVRRRAFDLDPAHVAEYAAVLTAMLSAHRRMHG